MLVIQLEQAARPRTPWWRVLVSSPRDTLYSRFYKGASWAFIGTALSQSSVVVWSMIAARLLGRESFGALGIIQSTVGVLGTFAGLGLGMTATKYVAELRASDPSRAGRVIGLSVGMSLATGAGVATALWVLSPWLATHAIAAPNLAGQLRIAAILLLLMTLNGVQTGTLSGLEAFRSLARVNLWRGIAALPVGVAAVWFGGLTGAVWALVASAALGCWFGQSAVRGACDSAGIPVSWRGAWRERAVLWRFSLPAFLSNVSVVTTWAAYAIMAHRPAGYSQLGAFNAANQFRNGILLVPAVVGQPLLPMLSDLYTTSTSEFRRLLRTSLVLMAMVSAAIALPVCLMSPWIMALFGARFRSEWPALVFLAASTIPAACCSIVGQAIAGSGKQWTGFALNFIWAAALIGITLAWGSHLNAVRLAMAFAASYAVHTITTAACALLVLKLRPHAPFTPAASGARSSAHLPEPVRT